MTTPAASGGRSGRLDATVFALLLCFVASGVSGLIYEVAWVRSLELIFGTTTFAVATVLAAFMGGLALGSYAMGRMVSRFSRLHPLQLYGILECAIAVLSLLVPWVLHALVPIYQWAWRATHASFVSFSLLRLALSALVLLGPTFLMGATLPVASEFVSGDPRSGRRTIGLLYACNTFGAVLGCLGAGLFLFPTIGLAGTQTVALTCNLLAAAGAFAIARRCRNRAAATAPGLVPVGESDPAAAGAGPARISVAARILVLTYAFSGFVAMLYEVAWSRILVLIVGSSTYAYTIMLGTFLLGLALGAGIMTRWLARKIEPLKAAALAQIVTGLATLGSVHLVEELPYLYLKAFEAATPSPHGLLGLQFLMAGGLMILPTLGLGAMFPITMQGLAPVRGSAGRVVGWAYALNTLGAIAGSVLAGFLFVPRWGSQSTLLAGVALNVLLAALAWQAAPTLPARLQRWRGAVTILGLLACLNLVAVTPAWSPAVLSSGIFRYVRDFVGLDRAGFRERARHMAGDLLMFEEGLTCTVTVTRTPETVTLMVNAKPDASTPSGLGNPLDTNAPAAFYDLPTQILLGQLPLLVAPRPEQVLVVGLGSGLTLGSVLTHPVRRVDCIELEKAVVRGSHFFEDHNRQPLADPRTQLIVNDARNHFLVSDETYDVIISEPSNPWIPGAANLFTREAFEQSRRRLRPDGVFCQWLQLYELQPDDFATVLRTFAEVYPHIHLFRVNQDAILLGSLQPQPISEAELGRRLAGRVADDLRRIDVQGVEDLLARYWIGGDELRRCIPPGPLNTDDNRRIEFAAPLQVLAAGDRQTGVAVIARLFEGLTSAAIPNVTLAGSRRPEDFWARVSEAALRQKNVEALIYAHHSLKLGLNPKAVSVQVDAWLALGRLDDARQLLERAETSMPPSPEVFRALARLEWREQRWTEAARDAARWSAAEPASAAARYLEGRALFQTGKDAEARPLFEALDPALARLEEYRDLPFYLGVLQARAGQFAPAIEHLQAFLRRMPLHVEARTMLAATLQRAGRNPEAAVQWQKIAILNIRQSEKLRQEAVQLWNAGATNDSIHRLHEAVRLDPSNDDLVLALARAQTEAGDPEAAARSLRDYLAWNPDRASAVGYLSQVLAALKQDDEARLMAARYRALSGSAPARRD